MRRIAFALAALSLAASPALAAGAFVQKTAQTPSGTLVTLYFDMSGTGVGPFIPTYVCTDGAGNVCATAGPSTANQGTPGTQPWPVTDPNNASYSSAGVATASGTLPSPSKMPTGGNPRGVQYTCGSTTPTGSSTTLTLPDNSTLPWAVSANNTANQGVAAISATAVTGCTFQALY